MSDAAFALDVIIDSARAKVGANAIRGELERLKGHAGLVTAATHRMAGAWDQVRASVFNLRTAMVGLGIAGFLSQATATITSFGDAMAGTQAVTHATAQEMVALEQQARMMGATTIMSATQAAQGQFYLGQAGLKTKEILGALPGTLDLAIAAELDLGRSSEIVAIQLRSFGLEVDETTRVTDILAKAASSSLTDVNMMAEAMKYAGPIASGFGMSLEETAAIAASLSNKGIQASMAGTTLRAAISDLVRPSGMAKKALAELGLTVDDVNPSLHSFVEIVETLAAAGADSQDLSMIFDTRALSGMSALVEDAERLRDMYTSFGEAAGETAYQTAIKQQTLSAAFKGVRSAMEELFLEAGDRGLAGAMRTLAEETTGVLRVWAGMEDSLGAQKDHFIELADKVELVGTALAGLATYRISRTLIPALIETARWMGTVSKASVGIAGSALMGNLGKPTAPWVSIADGPMGTVIPTYGGGAAAAGMGTMLKSAGPWAVAIAAVTVAWLNYKDAVIEVGETHATVKETAGAMLDLLRDGIVALPDYLDPLLSRLDVLWVSLAEIRDIGAEAFDWLMTPFTDAWEQQIAPTIEARIQERRRQAELDAFVREGEKLLPEQRTADVANMGANLWAELAEARRIEAASWEREPGPGGLSSATQQEVDAGIRAMELMEELRGMGDPLIEAIDEIEGRLANLQMAGAFPEQIEAARAEMDRINEGLALAGELGGDWGVQLGEAYAALHKAQATISSMTIEELGTYGQEAGAVIRQRAEEIEAVFEAMGQERLDQMHEEFTAIEESVSAIGEEVEDLNGNLEQTEPIVSGIERAFDAVREAVAMYRQDINSTSEAAFEMQRIFKYAEDQMVQAFVHGGMSAREFFSSLAVMAQEALVRQVVVQPIMSGITAAIGGMFGAPAGRMGGYSEDLPETQTVGLGAFAGAPEFAGGGTTLGLNPTVAGGGIPAVLHPNEAVVPLTAGRQIPVEITDGRPVEPSASAMVWAPTEMQSFIDNTKSDVRVAHVYVTAQDAGSFVRNRSQIQRAMRTALA